ncbi:MAG: FHA domain-containing protein [Candidatus Melainabacteria bacterium]|nr:FHA domain-containing protein [Candidatus Melainabacteria bacterium]
MQSLGLLRLGRAWHIIDETHFYTYETGTMDNQEGNKTPTAYLVDLVSNRKIPVSIPRCRVGRDDLNDIVISGDQSISRFHFIINWENGEFTVQDAKSRHGSFLNGNQIAGPEPIKDGDVLKVGVSLFWFVVESQASDAAPVAPPKVSGAEGDGIEMKAGAQEGPGGRTRLSMDSTQELGRPDPAILDKLEQAANSIKVEDMANKDEAPPKSRKSEKGKASLASLLQPLQDDSDEGKKEEPKESVISKLKQKEKELLEGLDESEADREADDKSRRSRSTAQETMHSMPALTPDLTQGPDASQAQDQAKDQDQNNKDEDKNSEPVFPPKVLNKPSDTMTLEALIPNDGSADSLKSSDKDAIDAPQPEIIEGAEIAQLRSGAELDGLVDALVPDQIADGPENIETLADEANSAGTDNTDAGDAATPDIREIAQAIAQNLDGDADDVSDARIKSLSAAMPQDDSNALLSFATDEEESARDLVKAEENSEDKSQEQEPIPQLIPEEESAVHEEAAAESQTEEVKAEESKEENEAQAVVAEAPDAMKQETVPSDTAHSDNKQVEQAEPVEASHHNGNGVSLRGIDITAQDINLIQAGTRPVPEWTKKYFADEIAVLNKELEGLNEQVRQAQNKIKEVETRVSLTRSIRNTLLTATGDELVEATARVLGLLGWKVTTDQEDKHELRLEQDEKNVCIARIIWTSTNAERSHLGQLSISQTRFWCEKGVEPKGILIVSKISEQAPEKMGESQDDIELADYAAKKNVCLMTTMQLLALYKEVALTDANPESLRQAVISASGWLSGHNLEPGTAEIAEDNQQGAGNKLSSLLSA